MLISLILIYNCDEVIIVYANGAQIKINGRVGLYEVLPNDHYKQFTNGIHVNLRQNSLDKGSLHERTVSF